MEIVNGTWEVAVATEIVETMNNGKPGIGIRTARIPRLKNGAVMRPNFNRTDLMGRMPKLQNIMAKESLLIERVFFF